MAERIAAFSRPGIELTKRTLWSGLDAASLEGHMQAEGLGQLFVRLLTANFEEAVAARAEKRPAALHRRQVTTGRVSVITATDLEVRAGARTLLSTDGAALRVQPGDRIGLVGRNGAGKTTTMRILAGEGEPYAGTIARTGEIGYLPQDPREGDLDMLARDRVLSARGLDTLLADLEKQQALMAEVADDAARDKAVRRYGELEERFSALGGYAAESEAGRICASLGLPERVLTQPLRTLSGGQRRRVELSRILFAASDTGSGSDTTLLLDEPTNHLDADSIGWLRELPAEPHRRPGGHQPQRRTARRRGQQGVVPRRRARRGRRLQHGLAEVPRCPRHRRTAPPTRTRQRREEGLRAAHPGRQDGRQGDQSRCRTEHAAPRRADDL